jgi:hypothetical protein
VKRLLEILYSIEDFPPERQQIRDGPGSPLTVLVNCVVDQADESSFRANLEKLLADFGRFPGTRGSMVFRREEGAKVELTIMKRFSGEQAQGLAGFAGIRPVARCGRSRLADARVRPPLCGHGSPSPSPRRPMPRRGGKWRSSS